MDKVYLIIVNYKTDDIIKTAIKSINEESLNIYTIIVDNEFSDSSFSNLNKLKTNKVEIITPKENLGFAGGVNFGFEYLESKFDDIDYIFLLNPDATVERNSISKLINTINQYHDVAAVSPRILNDQGENWFTGTIIDWENCKIINNPNFNKTENPIEIDVFNGCSVLLDAKKFKESGMFNIDTFLYYDEAFLSKEFLKRGYKILYNSNIINHHNVSYSTGYNSPLKHYYMSRNHLYFFNNYKNNNRLCKYKVPIKNTLWYLKNFKFEGFIAGINAIKDFLINKKGKK